jgi:hypothetical protein
MNLIVEIPDDVAQRLNAVGGDLSRRLTTPGLLMRVAARIPIGVNLKKRANGHELDH